jgi:hypothetical protein
MQTRAATASAVRMGVKSIPPFQSLGARPLYARARRPSRRLSFGNRRAACSPSRFSRKKLPARGVARVSACCFLGALFSGRCFLGVLFSRGAVLGALFSGRCSRGAVFSARRFLGAPFSLDTFPEAASHVDFRYR